MALREFTDAEGIAWTAWDVPASRVFAPLRSSEDRRVAQTPGYTPERRVGRDRRRGDSGALSQHGWVCFQGGEQKRRVTPPPPGWDQASDGELRDLCRRAAPDSPRR